MGRYKYIFINDKFKTNRLIDVIKILLYCYNLHHSQPYVQTNKDPPYGLKYYPHCKPAHIQLHGFAYLQVHLSKKRVFLEEHHFN